MTFCDVTKVTYVDRGGVCELEDPHEAALACETAVYVALGKDIDTLPGGSQVRDSLRASCLFFLIHLVSHAK